MGLKIGNITTDQRKTSFPYMGEDLTIKYKPSAWTPETEDTLLEEEGSNSFVELLSDLIIEWDVMEDDGITPYEPTFEKLRKLPSAFLVFVSRKIWEDMSPGEVRRRSAGSSRREGR